VGFRRCPRNGGLPAYPHRTRPPLSARVLHELINRRDTIPQGLGDGPRRLPALRRGKCRPLARRARVTAPALINSGAGAVRQATRERVYSRVAPVL
jgi:hypothetical protein